MNRKACSTANILHGIIFAFRSTGQYKIKQPLMFIFYKFYFGSGFDCVLYEQKSDGKRKATKRPFSLLGFGNVDFSDRSCNLQFLHQRAQQRLDSVSKRSRARPISNRKQN